jgi:hypothetical protein
VRRNLSKRRSFVLIAVAFQHFAVWQAAKRDILETVAHCALQFFDRMSPWVRAFFSSLSLRLAK